MSAFIACPKCGINAGKKIADALPNTTQGGKDLQLYFCRNCTHQWFKL